MAVQTATEITPERGMVLRKLDRSAPGSWAAVYRRDRDGIPAGKTLVVDIVVPDGTEYLDFTTQAACSDRPLIGSFIVPPGDLTSELFAVDPPAPA